MKKKLLYVLLMMVLMLSGCSNPEEKFTGMNGDYKISSGKSHTAGEETDMGTNDGTFFTITDMEKVNFRTGMNMNYDGTIIKKEIKDNVMTCTMQFGEGEVWKSSYFTYDLDNPDHIQLYLSMDENQTDFAQVKNGFAADMVRKAEGEKDTIQMNLDNFEIFIEITAGDDVISKSQVMPIEEGQVTDINNYYYLADTEGYDSLNLDVTVKSLQNVKYEKAQVRFTLKGTISNAWAVLESLDCEVDPAKKQVSDVNESILIDLDENGNGSGTVTIPCFNNEFNLENAIVNYDLQTYYNAEGTIILR